MVRSVRRLTSREAVLRTLDLHDRFGADEFLHRYGFGRSHRYRLLHGGREYDSKAVAGVAFGLQHPDLGPLRSEEFSGGASGAAYVLRRLGFDVVDIGGAPARAASPTLRQAPTVAELPASSRPPCAVGTGRRLLLLGCVKTKGPSAAPARDLYTSDLFDKRRRYAEASGLPWYVLSALHGLVLPHQVLEPYDMALKDQPRSYRTRWGQDVIQALEEQAGPLDGVTLEVHAGSAYADAIRSSAEALGARLDLPLDHLVLGQQLAWYAGPRVRPADVRRQQPAPAEVEAAVMTLTDGSAARSPTGFPWGRRDLASAGLYAWFIDDVGAEQLSHGLGQPVLPGLVYAGQAGATAWPSGTRRTSTLASRIGGNHLRGRITSSTWRLSLAAALQQPLVLTTAADRLSDPSDERLNRWMADRLRLTVQPGVERDVLSALEHAVRARLDPPLNLDGMTRTPLRVALSARRAALGVTPPAREAE